MWTDALIPSDALSRLAPVEYDILRPQLRTGDLALCSGDEAFSKLIRWATKSPWSHVALIVRLPGVRAPKPLHPEDEYICSEYVGKCFEQVGIRIPWDGRGFIAPADFAKAGPIEALAQVRTR